MANDKDTLAPEIRFKGFNDDWVQRKLGEVAELSSSKRIHVSDYVQTGIPFYRGSEISTGGVSKDSELYISENLYNEIKEKYGVPTQGDLLITAVGTLGNIWKVDERKFYYKDGNLIRLGNLKLVADYLIAYFADGKGKKEVLDSAAGSNQKALTMVKLNEIDLYTPIKEEQTAIGNFFSTLDDTITLHKRKLDGLKELKNGYLQQMFPQAGENVPGVRFAGFTGPWAQRKLGEIAERITRKNSNLESVRPLTISAQYGLIDQNDFFDKQVASKDVSNYFLLKNGEFAYNKSYSNGYPWGAVKRLDKYDMGVLSTLYIVFKPIDVESEFLVQYYETSNWHSEVASRAAEGARNHGLLNITPSDFFETNLFLPKTKDEQYAIGCFFQNIDQQIAMQQTKLDKLMQLKAAYLQKMFL